MISNPSYKTVNQGKGEQVTLWGETGILLSWAVHKKSGESSMRG